jgi:hypothetical protein
MNSNATPRCSSTGMVVHEKCLSGSDLDRICKSCVKEQAPAPSVTTAAAAAKVIKTVPVVAAASEKKKTAKAKKEAKKDTIKDVAPIEKHFLDVQAFKEWLDERYKSYWQQHRDDDPLQGGNLKRGIIESKSAIYNAGGFLKENNPGKGRSWPATVYVCGYCHKLGNMVWYFLILAGDPLNSY